MDSPAFRSRRRQAGDADGDQVAVMLMCLGRSQVMTHGSGSPFAHWHAGNRLVSQLQAGAANFAVANSFAGWLRAAQVWRSL